MIIRNKHGIYEGEWEGKQIAYPSVTTVLSILRKLEYVDPDVLMRAGNFGLAVHEMIKLYLEGTLDEENLDPHLIPLLSQFRKFQQDMKFVPEEWEKIVVNQKYQYAGRFDLAGKMNGVLCLIDLKTRPAEKIDGLQLAAYAEADGKSHYERYTLELQADRYILTPHTEKTDFTVFLSCLNIFNWRR